MLPFRIGSMGKNLGRLPGKGAAALSEAAAAKSTAHSYRHIRAVISAFTANGSYDLYILPSFGWCWIRRASMAARLRHRRESGGSWPWQSFVNVGCLGGPKSFPGGGISCLKYDPMRCPRRKAVGADDEVRDSVHHAAAGSGALQHRRPEIRITNADDPGSFGNAANTVVLPLTVVALAVATLPGQILTAGLSVWYLCHKKAVKLPRGSFGVWCGHVVLRTERLTGNRVCFLLLVSPARRFRTVSAANRPISMEGT